MADELLRGECPHCGQTVEYPREGTGMTVPCPTCNVAFVLAPVPTKAPPPPPVPPPPANPPVVASAPPEPAIKSSPIPPAAPAPEKERTEPVASVRPPPASLPVASRAELPPRREASPPPPIESPSRVASRPPLPPVPPRVMPAVPPARPAAPAPLDQAFARFAEDPAFAGKQPTREQVARAWALATFQNETDRASHEQVITALKQLFPEKKNPKAEASRSPAAGPG